LNLINYNFVFLLLLFEDYKKYSGQQWKCLHANSMILYTGLKYRPERLVKNHQKKLFEFVSNTSTSDRIPICMSVLILIGYYLNNKIKNNNQDSNNNEYAIILAKVKLN
jgi:hypothetical protein